MKNYFLMALMVTACIGLTGCWPNDEDKSVAELQSEVNELAEEATKTAQAEIDKADGTKDYTLCEQIKADAEAVKAQAGTATDEDKQAALDAKQKAEELAENAEDCAKDTSAGNSGEGAEVTEKVGVLTHFHSGTSAKDSTVECPANVTSFYTVNDAAGCSKSTACASQAEAWKTGQETAGWTCVSAEQPAKAGLAPCPPVKEVTWTCTKS